MVVRFAHSRYYHGIDLSVLYFCATGKNSHLWCCHYDTATHHTPHKTTGSPCICYAENSECNNPSQSSVDLTRLELWSGSAVAVVGQSYHHDNLVIVDYSNLQLAPLPAADGSP